MIKIGNDDVTGTETSRLEDDRTNLVLPENLEALTLNDSDRNSSVNSTLESDPNCDVTVTVAISCKDEVHPVSKVSATQLESKWQHLNKEELSSRSEVDLEVLLQQLRCRIEDVSAELVALLQERQRLREEVPIRNVTIAQLLKVHEQMQLSLPEPLAIQMSVIFPDQNEELDCK